MADKFDGGANSAAFNLKGRTARQIAKDNGFTEIVELIDAADAGRQNGGGKTVIDYARERLEKNPDGKAEKTIMAILVPESRTSLDIARGLYGDESEIVKTLLRAGAKANVP